MYKFNIKDFETVYNKSKTIQNLCEFLEKEKVDEEIQIFPYIIDEANNISCSCCYCCYGMDLSKPFIGFLIGDNQGYTRIIDIYDKPHVIERVAFCLDNPKKDLSFFCEQSRTNSNR